jgi:hypothetical protein
MKAALQQNPEILQALRSDVEAHVNSKLAELGVDKDTQGLDHRQVSRVSSLTSHHRKLASMVSTSDFAGTTWDTWTISTSGAQKCTVKCEMNFGREVTTSYTCG